MSDDQVSLSAIGSPAPMGYRVEQVQGPGPDGRLTMYVKLYLASPTGMATYFLDGEEAEALARDLRNAGRHAKMGIWSPQGGTPEPTGPMQRPNGGKAAPGTSSPSTSAGVG